MSLNCRIFRDEKGEIDFVNAPNGNRSKLFDRLVDMTGGNKETALNIYALSEVDELKEATEAKVKALKERYDRMVKIAPSTSPKAGEVLSDTASNIAQAIQRNNNLPLNLAPNGNPSILYQSYKDLGYSDAEAENLTAQVYSDSFLDFFGDWLDNPQDASKVVDENGMPRLVFHGTNADFTEFSKDLLGSKNWLAESAYMGFFFAGSQETSKAYTGFNMFEMSLKYPNLLKEVEDTLPDTQIKEKIKIKQEKQKQYVVEKLRKTKEDLLKSGIDNSTADFLTKMYNSSFYDQFSKESFEQIEDKSIKQDSDKLQQDRLDLLLKLYKERVDSKFNPNILNIFLNIKNPYIFDFKDSEERGLPYHIQQAKENGNDGVIFENLKDGAEEDSIYVAFDPNQIKSATENTGTFSTENNDIRFSRNKGEQAPKEVIDQVTDKLKESGLAKNVYKMTNAEIESKLKELGVNPTILDKYISDGKILVEC